jgi:two-component system response regulator GlrR
VDYHHIADDDEAVLFILRETCPKLGEGYQVASSSNGRQAPEQLAKEPCDVMVTDLKMCDVDAIQLTEAAGSSSPGMLVIWLTAYGCEGVQEEVARLGVRRCMNKPVGTSDIVRAVRDALGNAVGSGQVSMREAS